MTSETERDALAEVLAEVVNRRTGRHMGVESWIETGREAADAILASDWLAERDRQVRAEALREAAEEWQHGLRRDARLFDYGRWLTAAAQMLRERADRIEAGE